MGAVGFHASRGNGENSNLIPALTIAAQHMARLEAWNRTATYGYLHIDEHLLKITGAGLVNAKSVKLSAPKLHTTIGLEIACKLRGSDGKTAEYVFHGTIHKF